MELYSFDETFDVIYSSLTAEHETEVLGKAGFSEVRILQNWGAGSNLCPRFIRTPDKVPHGISGK